MITVTRSLALLCFGLSLLFALLMPVFFLHGFPVPFLEGTPFRIKSLRKLFEISFVLFVVGVLIHPERSGLLASLKEKASHWARVPQTIWILSGVFFLIFLWQQVTKYLSLNINFIPFLFYDYMLWFFDQGKFCFTGFLHGYYHVNLALLLLFPIWKIVPSPWVLHVAHPLIAASAAVPFFYWSRDRLRDAGLAMVAAFVYLSFRYLQNLIRGGFAVEVFYPFFIFLAVYAAMKQKNVLYTLAVFLGLCVKEDAVIYFGGLGLFFLLTPSHRRRGAVTIILSLLYALFIVKIFLPWSGSTILEGSLGNYKDLGSSLSEIVGTVARQPWLLIQELFVPLEKLRTLFKLTSKLLFLPLFSPWFAMVLLAIYPIFFRSVAGDQFIGLALYYPAPVLPFLFLAFVDGWARLHKKSFFQRHSHLPWGVVILLILLNGFNLYSHHFTKEDLKTIALVKGLPPEKIVVTQGHLLPYLGYRPWNFYLAPPFEKNSNTQRAYLNPDYYLFDFEANAYPLTPQELHKEADRLKTSRRFEVLHEDHRRLILRKLH